MSKTPSPGNKKALFFRTLPDKLNNNLAIEKYISHAYARMFPEVKVYTASVFQAVPLIVEIKPDFIIGVGSVALDWIDWSSICREAENAGAVLAYWLLDEPYEFDWNWKILGKCDWIFTSDRASLDYYENNRCSHLPLAADKNVHWRNTSAGSAKTMDVFFCGYAYDNRRRLIGSIAEVLRRYRSAVRGVNWQEGLEFCLNKRIDSGDLTDMYASSKVVINIGRDLNLANKRHEIVPSTPGPRLFEVAATGACQLCFLETTELFDYYDNETEVLTFSTVSEFDRKLQQIVEDDDLRTAVSERSRSRTEREHLYDHRVVVMQDVLSRNARS